MGGASNPIRSNCARDSQIPSMCQGHPIAHCPRTVGEHPIQISSNRGWAIQIPSRQRAVGTSKYQLPQTADGATNPNPPQTAREGISFSGMGIQSQPFQTAGGHPIPAPSDSGWAIHPKPLRQREGNPIPILSNRSRSAPFQSPQTVGRGPKSPDIL